MHGFRFGLWNGIANFEFSKLKETQIKCESFVILQFFPFREGRPKNSGSTLFRKYVTNSAFGNATSLSQAVG